jgi:hypothetical protein
MDNNPIAIRKVHNFVGWVTPQKKIRVLYKNQWPKKRTDWTMLKKRTKRIKV